MKFSQASTTQNRVIADIDAFYMKSVVDVDFAFRRFFTVKSAYIQNFARDLRTEYSNYQQSVGQFPFNRLSPNTLASFERTTTLVDEWLERGVFTAEVSALNYLWFANPNTGIRGPKTPAEEYLESSLKIDLMFLKETVEASDDVCLERFAPRIIPSYQPFTDDVVKASNDQIPTINDVTFRNSLRSVSESIAATVDFRGVIDRCASASDTDSCIQDFVS